MQLKGERIGRSTNLAFATPWEVCFNVAYPPQNLKKRLITKHDARSVSDDASRICFYLILKGGKRKNEKRKSACPP